MRVEEQAPTGAADPAYGQAHGHAGEHELPHESLSPITLAAGIGLLAFGLLTSVAFSIVGIAIMGWALATWIGEMRHG
jgi:hypothetical protein